jgi:hypothetical protein
MKILEHEVHISYDGLGRAAIVERDDGLLCIYVHWIWPVPHGRTNWYDDSTPLEILYHDKEPSPGIYATVADARNEVRLLPGFREEDSSTC